MATTDLETAGTFALANPEDLKDIWSEELAGIEGVAFERVIFPSGGAVHFQVPGDDPDAPDAERELTGVIVFDHPTAALWLEKKDDRPADQDDRPDANSIDGINQVVNEERIDKFHDKGLPLPSPLLAECPYNRFPKNGGIVLEEGQRGPATKNMWRFYLLRENAFLPIIVTIPPTSLKAWKSFKMNRVAGRGLRMCGVVTKITLKKESNNGNDYAVAQFQVVERLSPEQTEDMLKMRQQVAQMAQSVAITDSDYDTSETIDSRPVESDGASEEVKADDGDIPF